MSTRSLSSREFFPDLSGSAWGRLEEVLTRFEDAWRAGARPALKDYLDFTGVERRALLIELVYADLYYRLLRDATARVEPYLEQYPEVGESPPVVVELILMEYRQRREKKAGPSFAEYVQRFPQYQEMLIGRAPEASQAFDGSWMDGGTAVQAPPGSRESTPSPGGGSNEAPGAALGRTASGAPTVPGYEILEEVGRGGMGVVYKARHLALDRVVALKMVLAGDHAAPALRQRLHAEAEVVARLQHPHIVQIFDVGEHDGKPYLALEFCAGGGLDRRLAVEALPPREAARLIETLARAVHAAHLARVVHRDLKPANVLLTADGTPKVGDFGLARRLDQTGPTHTGTVLGTASYMAPEQAGGKTRDVGEAADVYSLGAILYECLTGRPPFKAATVMDTLMQVLAEEPMPPRRLQPSTPRDLETICLKCLGKQPDRRYQSALALADDLQRFLADQPIHARPARWPEHAGKWMKRRPVMAALFGVCLLASLALVAGAVWHTVTIGQALEQVRDGKREVQMREREVRDHLYAADLKLAHEFFWKNGDVARMAERLRRHLPGPGEEDRRGFAWHYLEQLSRGAGLATLPGHAGGALALAFSPDGRTLATGDGDGVVRLWDTAGWRLRRALPGQKNAVRSLAFSPDGSWLAGAVGLQALLWDTRDWRSRVVVESLAEVRGVAFAPDGKRLAAWGPWSVWLRDVATGKEGPSRTTAGYDWPIHGFAFGPDGKTYLGGENRLGGWVGSWNPDTGAFHEIVNHGAGVALAVHPSGGAIAISDARTYVHLVRFAAEASQVNMQHPHGARALAFSPNGQVLASADERGFLHLCDAAGAAHASIKGHTGAVHAVAFTPDGNRLASASADGTVRVWKADARQEHDVLRPAFEPSGPVAYTADGKQVLVACRDWSVRVLDAHTWQEKAGLRGCRGSVLGLAVAARGEVLATTSADRTVRVWDLARGRACAELWLATIPAASIALSPDGSLLAGEHAGTLLLWDWRTGMQRSLPHSHKGGLKALLFTPDGRSLTTAGQDGAKLWNLATGKASDNPRFAAAMAAVAPGSKLAFALDGKLVAAGASIEIELLDAAGRRTRGGLQGYRHHITGLTFAPDGRSLISTGDYGAVKRWDLKEHRVSAPAGQPMGWVCGLAFAPDSATLYTASSDPPAESREVFFGVKYQRHIEGSSAASIRVWDVATGTLRQTLLAPGMVEMRVLALSEDGQELAVGCTGGVVGRWSLPDRKERPLLFTSPAERSYWEGCDVGRRLGPLNPKFNTAVQALTYSADGALLAVADSKDRVQLWDTRSGAPGKLLMHGAGTTFCLAFSPDGRVLALNRGEQIELWDVASGTHRQTLAGHTEEVRCLAFSPDGTLLASGGDDWRIRLWDASSGKEKAVLSGHTAMVTALAFCSDKQTLASSGVDGRVHLWHLPTHQELFSLQGPTDFVKALAFAPDGQTLAGGSVNSHGGGEVYLWRTGQGRGSR